MNKSNSYFALAFLAGLIIGGLTFRQCSSAPQQSNGAIRELARTRDTNYTLIVPKEEKLKSTRGEVRVVFPPKNNKIIPDPRAFDSNEVKKDIAKIDSIYSRIDSLGIKVIREFISVSPEGDTTFSVFELTRKTLDQTLKKAPYNQATIIETRTFEVAKEPAWYESKTLWFLVGLGAGAVATFEVVR